MVSTYCTSTKHNILKPKLNSNYQKITIESEIIIFHLSVPS